MNKRDKNCSLKPLVSPYNFKRPIQWEEQFNQDSPMDVEIGFGMGEVLMRMARENPERNFVGIEQHWQRIYKTLKAITREQHVQKEVLENIRILNLDARVCFERLFASKSIETIYCLFPCPWPKKGHIKHRLFSNAFLKLLNNRLKNNGTLKIVTDFYPYREWILEQIIDSGFDVETKKVCSQYDTKFERKWREEGQEQFFELNLAKKQHINVPVKKDKVLKNYTLDELDADKLQLVDEKGPATVIFKNKIFDRKEQKILIQSIVVEEHLTQHFWIVIAKKNNQWSIAKAEGQNFFPTAGIAKALDLVYKAACTSSEIFLRNRLDTDSELVARKFA